MNEKYDDYFKVRNNCASVRFRYLQVRLDHPTAKKLNILYPEYSRDFDDYEEIKNDLKDKMSSHEADLRSAAKLIPDDLRRGKYFEYAAENDEDNEVFTISVSSLENVTTENSARTYRIIDNDGAPNIFINNARVTEGGSVEIPINLSNASELDVSVDFVTTDVTAKAGTDYQASSGTLVISAGDTVGVISITTTDDQLDEEDKSFTLTLSNPQNAELYRSSIDIEIFDNDETPIVTAASQVNEEGETVVITFALSDESGRDISFNYATKDGAALAGSDYTSQNGSITFAAGESIKTLNIATLDDAFDENRENFTVSLSNPVNVELGISVIQIALDDNDDEPTVSITGSSVSESANSATAVISLSSASGKAINVSYSTNETNSAEAIRDYIPVSSSITFAPGETQKTINIDLVNDTIREASETFEVSLGSILNAVAGVNNSTLIISGKLKKKLIIFKYIK